MQTFIKCDSFNLGFETHSVAGVQLEVSKMILEPRSQNALCLDLNLEPQEENTVL